MRPISRKTVVVAAALFAVMSSASTHAQAQARSETRKLELTLRPWGFESSEFRLRPGRWQVTVRNRVGLRQLSMQIARESSQSLAGAVLRNEVVDRSQKISWDYELDLTPGTYLLRETSHPRWQCRIIIAP